MKNSLLPYQRRWVADRAGLKVIEKSRRIGISWCEAYDAVLHAGGESGGNVYYQSYNQDMTRGFIDDCAEWARRLQVGFDTIGETLIADGDRDVKAFRIAMASGREIVAMTSAPRAFRSKGRPGDLGIIDEAAFVDDLSEVIKSALAFRVWGGRAHIISTHNGEANPFAALCRDIREGLQPGSLHRVTFADALEQGLYKRICAITGTAWSPEAEAAWEADIRAEYGRHGVEELDVTPAAGSGAWLSWEVIRALEHPDAGDPEMAGRGHVYIGIDVARRRDLWVAAVLERVGDVLWVRELVVRHNIPFSEQRFIVRQLVGQYNPVRVAVDQTGMGEAFVEQLQDDHGAIRVEGVLLSAPRRLDVATALREAAEDKRLRTPADQDLRQDLHSVRAEGGGTGAPRLLAETAVTDGHADRFWALALACSAAADGKPAYGYTAAGRGGGASGRRGWLRPDHSGDFRQGDGAGADRYGLMGRAEFGEGTW